MIRHRSAVVAEHPVLAGRAQFSVLPEHGPGAAACNARQRYAAPAAQAPVQPERYVQVRDPAVYDKLLESERVVPVA